MPILSKPSSAARMSIMYITVGALIDVWAAVYWLYLGRHPEGHSDVSYYWVYGFFFTGLVLLLIGLGLGEISRSARRAELPPAVPPEPTAEPPANAAAPAAQAGVLASGNAAPQYYTAPGQVVLPGQQATVVQPVPAVPANQP